MIFCCSFLSRRFLSCYSRTADGDRSCASIDQTGSNRGWWHISVMDGRWHQLQHQQDARQQWPSRLWLCDIWAAGPTWPLQYPESFAWGPRLLVYVEYQWERFRCVWFRWQLLVPCQWGDFVCSRAPAARRLPGQPAEGAVTCRWAAASCEERNAACLCQKGRMETSGQHQQRG